MPIDRKAAIREFKERKAAAGVFAIRCLPTDQVWVASSRNLRSAQNSQFFQLRTGTHRNRELQTAWNELGEGKFGFEVLEELPEDTAELVLSDLLGERVREWTNRLTQSN